MAFELMQQSTLPLCGVKVVDFGQYLAGPAVAMILADLGATVVHVDPPGGPLWASPANATLQRNKLIVEIDLKTAEGLARAQAFVAQADIVVENFRPGVLARFGIDFTTLREERPELITVSIPGFASNDELRRDWRAFEAVIAASSLHATSASIQLRLYDRRIFGRAGAAGARTHRHRRQHRGIACALTEGLAYNTYSIDKLPARYRSRRRLELERRREGRLPMNVSYEGVEDLRDPMYRNYDCKGGGKILITISGQRIHEKRFLQMLGLYDQLVAEGLAEGDPFLPIREWPAKAMLGAMPLARECHDRITAWIKATFLTRTAEEWEGIPGEGRVGASAHSWLKDWMRADHARSAGLAIEVDDPIHGRMIQPGPVAWLEECGETMMKPAPRRWVTVDQALAAFACAGGKPAPAAAPAGKPEGWLAGVRILDMSNVIAGPHSVAYLARFGAEVIKLDPVKTPYDAWMVTVGMVTLRGKRSVLVDVRSSGGREVFERLVKSADLIVWNATDAQARRMGFDAESLEALNPRAILSRIDCFGGVGLGPRSDHLGYDDLSQAATGIMLRFGGSMERLEEHAHVGTIDALAGYASAITVGAALYQRARTDRAGRARASLCATAGFLQVPFFYDYEGRGAFDEPSGFAAKGYDALAHLYQAACGRTVMLSASERDLPRFARVAGLESLASLPAAERALFLAAAFPKASAEEWVSRLREADIAVAICDTLESLRASNTRAADGTPGTAQGSYSFATVRNHPSGRAFTMVDDYAVRALRTCIPCPPQRSTVPRHATSFAESITPKPTSTR